MVALFFLGRDVEEAYGGKEFLRLYLAMVVFASLVWNVVTKLAGPPDGVAAIGASGAIAGVVVLYALNFPRRTLLLFFVIPMPAWLCGVLICRLGHVGGKRPGWGLERGLLDAPGRRRLRLYLLPAPLEPDAAEPRGFSASAGPASAGGPGCASTSPRNRRRPI